MLIVSEANARRRGLTEKIHREPKKHPSAGEACSEIARVLKPGGFVCLLDIMFASPEAAAEASRMLGRFWDEDEDYPLVGAMDSQLRAAGISATCWRQTAPCHWVVVGHKKA